MAPSLQNTLFIRSAPIDGNAFYNFMGGLLDERSLRALLLLNSVPLSVSGLRSVQPTNLDNLLPENWFPGVKLTKDDIINAFTYALVTEQLKRVDALLRSTVLMHEAVETQSHAALFEMFHGLRGISTLSSTRKNEILARLPNMNYAHPIVQAANAELERILSLTSSLQSGSPEMVAQARRGLLDSLRNSLAEIWMSDETTRSKVTRSVFNSMLSVLDRVTKVLKDDKGNPYIVGEVTYSVLLTSVQRMWSVHWRVGHQVSINVVKSRVALSVLDNALKVDRIGAGIKLSGLRI
jgi:hypothetical protein